MTKERITQIINDECKKHIDAGKDYEIDRTAEYSQSYDFCPDIDRKLVNVSELLKLGDLISIHSTRHVADQFNKERTIIDEFSMNETLWDSVFKTCTQKNIDDVYKAIENVRLYVLDYINQK